MKPKEAYEARKAARKAAVERQHFKPSETDEIMFDMMSRFVAAAERIADAMERQAPTTAKCECGREG